MIPSILARGEGAAVSTKAAGTSSSSKKFHFRLYSLLLLICCCDNTILVVQAQNDFDVGGCTGLMPDCTYPIFKCGDESPLCGGNVKKIVENCTSNLFICNPIDDSEAEQQQQQHSVSASDEEEPPENDINYNLIIYDLDGPDETAKPPYLWPGWSFYSDVCSELRRARPTCGNTRMMYQCDEKRPYCGAIDKERAKQLMDPDAFNCYRMKLCSPIGAKVPAKVGMLDHLVVSTEEGIPDMRDAPYWREFFSSSATTTRTTTTTTIFTLGATATTTSIMMIMMAL